MTGKEFLKHLDEKAERWLTLPLYTLVVLTVFLEVFRRFFLVMHLYILPGSERLQPSVNGHTSGSTCCSPYCRTHGGHSSIFSAIL